ncbi:MAG: ABC transporter substrate-binding protein [Lysobacterales bacterium]
MRIVTLLPSATDMVLALGCGESLVGVSHSCDLPASLNHLPRMTSTWVSGEATSEAIDTFVRSHLADSSALYELDLEGLEAATPDVIISQGLCDVCAVATGEVIDAVNNLPGNPVLVDLNPNSLNDILNDVLTVGRALGIEEVAQTLRDSLAQRIDFIALRNERLPASDRPRAAFMEWLLPLFNGGHWNPHVVDLAGAKEVFGNPALPSQTRSFKQLAECDPDILVVACCGYHLEQTQADLNTLGNNEQWRSLRAVRDGRIFIADGQDYFARPSPSIVDALERLAVTLHPTRFAALDLDPFKRFAETPLLGI